MNCPGQDQLYRHGALLLMATQVANVCNLFFQVVMGRSLAREEYGVLASMLGVVLVLATPMDAVRTALAHFTARFAVENRRGAVLPLVGRWLGIMSLFSAAVLLAVAVFHRSLTVHFQLDSTAPLFLTALILAGSFYLPVFVGTLQGGQAFGLMAVAQHSWSVVRLLAGGLLVWAIAPKALWGLAGQAGGVMASAILGVVGLGIMMRGVNTEPEPGVSGVGRYFGFSLMALGGYAVLMNADVVMVKLFFNPAEAGVFAQAATIGRAVVFLPMPVALAMFPKVTTTGAVGVGTRRTLGRACLFAGLLILLAAALVTALPAVPLRLLYRIAQPEADLLRLVRQVTWAMSPLGLGYVLLHFELAQHRFRPAIVLVVCAAGYVTAVGLRHETLQQVIAALAVSAGLAGLLLLVGLPWRRTPAGEKGA